MEPDPGILEALAADNREDVRSTAELHSWLGQRRGELVAHPGPLPRPEPTTGEVRPELSAAEAAESAPADRCRRAGPQLLAGLVGWHRRQARPAWWEVLRCGELGGEELIEDPGALGGLCAPVAAGTEKRSTLWR